MVKAFVAFLKDQSGVTGIEYGVLTFATALVLVSAAGAAGRHLRVIFQILGGLSAHAR